MLHISLIIHYGLSAILVYVGIKMLLADAYKIHALVSLGVVVVILIISVIASLIQSKRVEVVSSELKR